MQRVDQRLKVASVLVVLRKYSVRLAHLVQALPDKFFLATFCWQHSAGNILLATFC
jgi:hypothetical protein